MLPDEILKSDFSFKKLFVPLTFAKCITIIIIVGFLVYGNMLFNSFVEDDLPYLINYPPAQKVSISAAFGPSTYNIAGQYRPILAFYASLFYHFFSSTPFPYHFIHLLIHISCTLLIYLLFNRAFARSLALLLSLIFLVHPINVESVSYFIQSANPVFLLLGISAILISTRNRLSKMQLGIILLLLLLSILTKETGVLFFLLIFAYRWFFARSNMVVYSIGATTILIVYFLTRFFIGHVDLSTRPLVPIAALPLMERLINIPAVMFYYLKTFFFPRILAIDQHWLVTNVTFTDFYLPLLIDISFLSVLVLVGVYLFRRNKQMCLYFCFFSIWFLFGLFMHLQVFPLDKTVADRWFYFPAVGLIGLFGALLSSILSSKRKAAHIILPSLLILVIVFSARTITRNMDYRDNLTLYLHDIKIHTNYNNTFNLGLEYDQQGNYTEAIRYYKKSIELHAFEANLFNLAYIYEKMGDKPEAIKYYSMLIAKKRTLSKSTRWALKPTYERLAKLFFSAADYESAAKTATSGLKEFPTSAMLLTVLASSEYQLGHKDSAIDAAAKARANILHEF